MCIERCIVIIQDCWYGKKMFLYIIFLDQDVLDGSALITEGIVEAETLNDSETQAQFMLQAAFLDIQEGHPRKGVLLMLKVHNILYCICIVIQKVLPSYKIMTTNFSDVFSPTEQEMVIS